MPMPTTLIILALILGGCGKEDPAPGAVTAPRPSSIPDDEPVKTVDDTVPVPAVTPTAQGADEPVEEDPTEDDDDVAEEDEDCAPKGAAGLKPMQVLAITFTSGIEGKDPADKINIARPGQRVYAHLKMRNRSGRKRCLDVTFRVGGKKRTKVRLKIGESWSWRTWAYNTLRPDDRQPLELTIVDDQGALVFQKKLPVVPE